jgi:hypothetical protein
MGSSFERGGEPLMAKDPVCGWRSLSGGLQGRMTTKAVQQRFEEDPTRYSDPRTARQDATRRLTVQPSEEGGPCVL